MNSPGVAALTEFSLCLHLAAIFLAFYIDDKSVIQCGPHGQAQSPLLP